MEWLTLAGPQKWKCKVEKGWKNRKVMEYTCMKMGTRAMREPHNVCQLLYFKLEMALPAIFALLVKVRRGKIYQINASHIISYFSWVVPFNMGTNQYLPLFIWDFSFRVHVFSK